MDEDMGIIFTAVDENYKMAMQYKYTWNTLQNFGQFRDKRIWKNFTYFIDWMEKNFEKEKFFEVMGKSYDLEDSILYRIQKTEDKKSGKQGEKESRKFETWLMSNVFRHVENPDKEKSPEQKYIGRVKFTKIHKKSKYEDSNHDLWTPPMKDQEGKEIETRKSVEDIQIVVYNDDKMTKERRYELEHGWDDQWITEGIHELNDLDEQDVKYNKYQKFVDFERKWKDLENKKKIPGWYHFDPRDPKVVQLPNGEWIPDPKRQINQDYNMMKKWDNVMFDFLQAQEWNERMEKKDEKGRNQYEEKPDFVVDCSQLLGIGGEAVVIKKSVREKVGKASEDKQDREFEALKIIPIMKHNFNDDEEKVKEMETRVTARHKQADPEKFFGDAGNPERRNTQPRLVQIIAVLHL